MLVVCTVRGLMLANMYQHSTTLANFSSSCLPLPNHLVHAYIQLFLYHPCPSINAIGPAPHGGGHNTIINSNVLRWYAYLAVQVGWFGVRVQGTCPECVTFNTLIFFLARCLYYPDIRRYIIGYSVDLSRQMQAVSHSKIAAKSGVLPIYKNCSVRRPLTHHSQLSLGPQYHHLTATSNCAAAASAAASAWL